MNDLATTWPVIKRRHYLAHTHDVTEHLDVLDHDRNVDKSTLGFIISLDSLIDLNALKGLNRRYQVFIVLLSSNLLCLVDVHHIQRHQVLDSSQRIIDIFLLVVRLEHQILQLFIDLRLVHSRPRRRSYDHSCEITRTISTKFGTPARSRACREITC